MLDTPVEYVKGIGPQRAEVLRQELGVRTAGDLLMQFPFRYVDRTKFQTVGELTEDLQYAQLKGVIDSMQIVGKHRGKRLVANFRDDTGSMELVWFQGYNWIAEKLKTGVPYIVFGKVNFFNGRFSITHPEMDTLSDAGAQAVLQPVYSSTEKLKARGLDTQGLRKVMRGLVSQLRPEHIPETLPVSLMASRALTSRFAALRSIHFPEDETMLQRAEYRLKFEELFFIQIRLLRLKKGRESQQNGFVFSRVGDNFNFFFHNLLPFPLTGAQKRVLREIRADMGSGRQMNRLLQGDVGSGKTLVALMSMLLAIDNGFQTCLMAPTEILAQQHYATFRELVRDMPLGLELLTGFVKAKARAGILQRVSSGESKILVGTHALIEDTVLFANLGLVVIDEQHRFGVAQRARLASKNTSPPHILLMTATPIPRTLAMTLYGDLDTSVIDEMPPGRKPVVTRHFTEAKRLAVFGFMKEQIRLGRQVYVVYPLIQESEKSDYRNLQEGYDNIVREFPPPEYQVSIVHGKLSNEQKEREMQRFIKGETQIMVATTVIEVGVNVPNASVMIIESSERFGLSQLHQLRGRVGRGADQSYCILMTGYKLGADSRLRMKTMDSTTDGFEISEVDLKLRGPGDIEGTQQSGVMELKIANLAKDTHIVQAAREEAQKILDEDPLLAAPSHAVVAARLEQQALAKTNWSKVG